MPGTSTKTHMISFRLDVGTIAKIQAAINTASNDASSVSDYCKKAVIRHVWRHEPDKRKIRSLLG